MNTYVRILFIDNSSDYNTTKLITKLRSLGLNISLCNWILDFLTGRPQVVRVDNSTSAMLALNTGAPQGCVLSPLGYSLFTHDCMDTQNSNTVVGLITKDNETALGRRSETRQCGDRTTTSTSTSVRQMS